MRSAVNIYPGSLCVRVSGGVLAVVLSGAAYDGKPLLVCSGPNSCPLVIICVATNYRNVCSSVKDNAVSKVVPGAASGDDFAAVHIQTIGAVVPERAVAKRDISSGHPGPLISVCKELAIDKARPAEGLFNTNRSSSSF